MNPLQTIKASSMYRTLSYDAINGALPRSSKLPSLETVPRWRYRALEADTAVDFYPHQSIRDMCVPCLQYHLAAWSCPNGWFTSNVTICKGTFLSSECCLQCGYQGTKADCKLVSSIVRVVEDITTDIAAPSRGPRSPEAGQPGRIRLQEPRERSQGREVAPNRSGPRKLVHQSDGAPSPR